MSRLRTLYFYAEYVWAKFVLLWFDVKRPRFQLFLYELLYSAGRPFKASLPDFPSLFRATEVCTVHGRFRIRANTMDLVCASPAFERSDLRRMVAAASGLARSGRHVLFLDVGADFGTYTVAVGNAVKRSGGAIRIVAFEPAASSSDLLRHNVTQNGLDGIAEVRQVALWEEDAEDTLLLFSASSPGSSGLMDDAGRRQAVAERVATRRLDSVLADTHADVVLMKLDVEGAEVNVLKGAADLLRRSESILMVEDFVDAAIVRWLRENGWKRLGKFTPYNSWWHRSAALGASAA